MRRIKVVVAGLSLGAATLALSLALLGQAGAQINYNGDTFHDLNGKTLCLCSGTGCPNCKHIE